MQVMTVIVFPSTFFGVLPVAGNLSQTTVTGNDSRNTACFGADGIFDVALA
jgi:hypothetical protein